MAHCREQIRAAVVQALVDSGDYSKVFTQRFNELPPISSPGAAAVYTFDEMVERSTMNRDDDVVQQRRLTVEVDLFTVDMNETFQDSLDDMTVNLEMVMVDALEALELQDFELVSSKPDGVAAGNGIVACMRVEYAVIYRTLRSDPQTLIP